MCVQVVGAGLRGKGDTEASPLWQLEFVGNTEQSFSSLGLVTLWMQEFPAVGAVLGL
ncbi:hypothetical protein P7K49_034850, partial [Saguinus oedipus]